MKSFENEQDAAEILQRLQALDGRESPVWGKMSAGEMVCHLRESFRAGLGEIKVTPMKSSLPPRVMKWLALRAPMKWPAGIQTVAELKVGQPGTVPAQFTADRAETMEAMARFRAGAAQTEHPIFGTMTRGDWLRWGYLHCDHHLRQFGR